jgi:hypothetical protein
MNYFKPVILLGFVIPIGIMLVLLGGMVFVKGRLDAEYNKRKEAFSELRENEQKAIAMENSVLPHRGAVAYFEKLEENKIAQTLPSVLEDFCNGRYQGYVIRTGLRIDDDDGTERAEMEFLGRYDSLQKMTSELQVQFPFLKFTSGSFRPVDPSTSVPSKHLNASFRAYNFVDREDRREQ